MRLLVCAALAVLSGLAQSAPKNGPTATVTIPEGSATKVVPLFVDNAPGQGDRFVISVSNSLVKVSLVTPDGRKVARDRAMTEFEWSDDLENPALGATDGGHTIVIAFKGRGTTGSYIVELIGENLTQPATASVRYISSEREYDAMMKELRGFRSSGRRVIPRPPTPAVTILTVVSDDTSGVFDIVTADEEAHISLKIPGGRILDESDAAASGAEWNKFTPSSDELPLGFMADIAGFLPPERGVHHLVRLSPAKAGRYEIRVGGAQTGAEWTAAFIPVGELSAALEEQIGNLGQPPTKVRRQSKLSP